jgi:hypothetical protein
MPPIQFRTVSSVIAILVFISGLLFFTPAVRAEPFDPDLGASWRCGNLVMEKGLTKRQVLDACGKPVHVEKSYLEDYGEVEKLVYGPDAGYMYRLIFFDDRLVNIKSQPY